MPEIESCVRKIYEEEVDVGSTLSECLLFDMAAAINAICDFTTNVSCEVFTADGVYTTKPKSSSLIMIGVGGGGGGGGGAQGAVLQQPNTSGFNANSVDIFTLRLLGNGGTGGSDGADGTDTLFGTDVIATGGSGGDGGKIYLPGTLLPRFNPIRGWGHNEDRVYLQQIIKSLELVCHKEGPMLNGIVVGSSAPGGTGTASFETSYNVDTNMFGGGDGYYGAPGNIGFKCFQAQPSTSYNITIGKGGAGGAEAPDTVVGGDTITGATAGSDGSDGGLLILELGF